MIKKIYRLNETQLKKVLKFWKPFFSYWIVLNYIKNDLTYNRFWIIIWAKSVENNITRNFFRRFLFDSVRQKIFDQNNTKYDFVFTVKKQFKLDIKNIESINTFEKDIKFLLKWFYSKNFK